MIIPVRNGDGRLRAVLRYAPSHDHAPKVLAARGTRGAGMISHPCAESSSRRVSVALDCDRAGREAAARIAADLSAGCAAASFDLARARADGYDLTGWLAERENLGAQELPRMPGAADARPRAGVPAAGR